MCILRLPSVVVHGALNLSWLFFSCISLVWAQKHTAWAYPGPTTVYVTLNKLLNLLKLHPSLCLGQKPEGHLQVLSFSHTPIYLATVLNVVSNLTPSLPLLPPELSWIRPVFSFLSSQTNLEIRIRPSHSRLTVAY